MSIETNRQTKTGKDMSHMPNEKDYYCILDVHPSATMLEIREAFIRMKTAYGSDSPALYSLIDEVDARESMKLIETAFRTLNDPQKREKYDDSIGISKNNSSDRFPQISDGSELGGQTNKEKWQVERLGSLRKEESPSALEIISTDTHVNEPQMVVRTSRSTLPVTRTTASDVDSDSIQSRFAEIIEIGDPGDGDMYRLLREAAGVSLDELQDCTKVSREYLESIESNTFDRLPSVVYVKGFLKSCFKYLKVPDSDKLVLAYAERLEDWHSTRKM